jgi:hypothetical protein
LDCHERKGVESVKKPLRRVVKNHALRNELIAKGFIVPNHMVPAWLKTRGYLEAAKAAAARRGQFFHV